MGLRKLPNENEAQELITEYKLYMANGDLAGLERLQKQWGYGDRSGFYKAMKRAYGIPFRFSSQRQVIEEEPNKLTDIEKNILSVVRKQAVSVGEISRQVDRSAETVIKTIDSLREKSYEVILDEVSQQVSIPQEPTREFKPTEFKYFKKFYRIGLVSDAHMCSKYQQVTLLHDAYADFNKRQVDFVLNAGDLVDGRDVYRGQQEETFLYGADAQKDYVVQNYPKLERGRKTYVIGGQHDRSFFKDKGYNIIRAICQERKDLIDRGFYKAEFTVKGLLVGLQHPGGGVAYALSYKPQKIIESMMGYINSIPSATKPILQIFGHWHVAVHIPSYMGIDVISMPCFQAQTPYLEQLGKMPVVGYAVAEIYLDKDNNLTSTKIEFVIQNSQIRKADY